MTGISQTQVLLFGCVLLLAVGCSNRSMKTLPPVEELPGSVVNVFPYDLQVLPGDGRLTVQWKKAGDGLYSGYNIYIGERSIERDRIDLNAVDTVTPFNIGPYPGDTDPDDGIESFEAENLVNGRKYYVTVRVIRPDRSLSAPSNEVVAVCGPRGEIELDQRFSGMRDGFSLDKNMPVRADATDNDLYFYSKDGVDYLASPRRLGGYLRQSTFSLLEYEGELRDIAPRLAKADPQPAADKVAVKPGNWILLRTQDDRNAVLRVLETTGDGDRRRIRLYLAYCPVAGEMIF